MSVSLCCLASDRKLQELQCSTAWSSRMQRERLVSGLLQMEEKYLISPLYITSIQRDPETREALLHWMLQVCCSHGCVEPVLALAISLLDRYLSVTLSLPISPVCLAAACILISSKLADSKPVSTNHLCTAAQLTFSPNNLLDMETIVLSTLRWDVATVTPQDFLPHFLIMLKQNECEGETESDCEVFLSNLHSHSNTVIALCATDSRLLGKRASLMAASALCAAFHMMSERGPHVGTMLSLARLCETDMVLLQYYSQLLENIFTEHLTKSDSQYKNAAVDDERPSTPTDLQDIDF